MYFPYLFSDLDINRYFISARDAVKRLWISWKSLRESRTFHVGVNEIQFRCWTAKPYNLLKIKKAVAKPVCCVMEYTIYNIVIFII